MKMKVEVEIDPGAERGFAVTTLEQEMTEREYKKLIIPCKVCARKFELRLPIEFYDAVNAVAEGDAVKFGGTCPDCRAENPLLRFLDEHDIHTIGRYFARKAPAATTETKEKVNE